MIGPFARIIARYISGSLVTYGIFTAPEAAQLNPDIVLIVGAVLGAAVEFVYAYAKRKGWAT